jgi:hypothetical protein
MRTAWPAARYLGPQPDRRCDQGLVGRLSLHRLIDVDADAVTRRGDRRSGRRRRYGGTRVVRVPLQLLGRACVRAVHERVDRVTQR